MRKLKIVLIMLLAAVTGCHEQNTYDYYMVHPKELKKEYTRCQTTKGPQCEEVSRAADDFSKLLEDESNDPEALGQRIIQMQQELNTLAENYSEAQKAGDSKQIQLTEEEYQDAKKKLDILYAVVGMRSPE